MVIDMEIVLIVSLFILGSILASFFTLVGMRVPLGEPIDGRSVCDHCGVKLPCYALIPILGFFLVKGRCHNCRYKVSFRYPVYEALGGLLFALGYLYLQENVVEYLVTVVFVMLLLTVAVSDIEYQVVPDKVLIAFAPVVLVLRLLFPLSTVGMSIAGGVAAFLFMWALAAYGRYRFKRDALGGGDIKLYGLIGIFLGLELVFLSLFFAALVALFPGRLVLRKVNPIPFVPFIFVGVVLAYLFGPMVIDWYVETLFIM